MTLQGQETYQQQITNKFTVFIFTNLLHKSYSQDVFTFDWETETSPQVTGRKLIIPGNRMVVYKILQIWNIYTFFLYQENWQSPSHLHQHLKRES